jgi:hypothetical protein
VIPTSLTRKGKPSFTGEPQPPASGKAVHREHVMRTSIPSELRALVSVLGVLTLSACTSAPTAVAPLPRKAAAVGSGSQAVQNKGRQDITSGITHWYASRDINVDGLRVRNSGTSLYIHGPGDVRVNGEVWVQDGGFLQLQEGVTMQIMNTKAGVNSHRSSLAASCVSMAVPSAERSTPRRPFQRAFG